MVRLFKMVLSVSDIDQAERFYSMILGTQGKRISKGKHQFDCGGAKLICYDPLTNGDKLGKGWMLHPNQFLYFSVVNLETTYIKTKRAGCTQIDDGIQLNNQKERFFCAHDPFGNPICFIDEKTIHP